MATGEAADVQLNLLVIFPPSLLTVKKVSQKKNGCKIKISYLI